MIRFRRNLTIISILLILAITTFLLPKSITKNIKMGFVSFTRPILQGINRTGAAVRNNVGAILTYRIIIRENRRLSSEVDNLKKRIVDLQEASHENKRLRELLAFKETSNREITPAQIIGWDSSPWSKTILINKGAKEGLTPNAAVVSSSGLVGRIVELGPRVARVILITDPNSRVGAIIQRTREQGAVEGKGGLCRMKYISSEAEVKQGDMVISSGKGEIYPKGLVIGKIVKTASSDDGLFQTAIIQPAVNFSKLEEVLCLREGS